MQTISFSVDSELLRELGERLVGRQYIALAELVKNSFDADATRVEIRIRDDSIEVLDNGHGMTADDFASRWMRVGSTHKVHEMTSPVLKRKLTGSKGVGRLAVQFLASELELTSVPNGERVPEGSSDQELFAKVDWDTAVQARELTQATAEYELREPSNVAFPLKGTHGTTVTLKRLKHEWSPEEFQSLAREIWFLQPPFRSLTGALRRQGRRFRGRPELTGSCRRRFVQHSDGSNTGPLHIPDRRKTAAPRRLGHAGGRLLWSALKAGTGIVVGA